MGALIPMFWHSGNISSVKLGPVPGFSREGVKVFSYTGRFVRMRV